MYLEGKEKTKGSLHVKYLKVQPGTPCIAVAMDLQQIQWERTLRYGCIVETNQIQHCWCRFKLRW